MWDQIQAHLTEMPQFLFDIDIIQALNPLYALPVIAVVLCAFLVYAFGFKAPVQPPSFDEIEIDKKTAKRRKGKENQKNKQQNGKVGGTNAKASDNSVTEKKKKSEKAQIVEKKPPKPEPKAGKKSVDKKKKPSISLDPTPVIEDGNDEGWVHLVPKKGRKGRKKDDASLTQTQLLLEFCNKAQENIGLSEDFVLDESNQAFSLDPIGIEDSPTKITELAEIKLPIKLTSLKKQKSKKKDNKENIDIGKIVGMLPEEQKFESPDILQMTVEPEEVVNHGLVVSKEKKPAKKKKKKPEADEKVTTPETLLVETSPLDLVSTNTDKNIELESKELNADAAESGGKKDPDGPIEATGQNVAFDELQGLYQDPKPLKKKKKVRRDH